MKKYTNKELKSILSDINRGTVYCGIDRYGRGIGKIQKGISDFIGYSHFGGSAIRNNTEELKWLLEVIFKDCEMVVPAIWSNYHINYIPIDKQYKGIDCSTRHPNVMGL